MLNRVKNNNPTGCRLFILPATVELIFFSFLAAACVPQSVPLPVSSPPPNAFASPISPTLEPPPVSTDTTFRSAFPDSTNYTWSPVITGLDLVVDIQNAGDGTGRLFIVEKRGQILALQNNQLLAQPFLDISSLVDSRGTEQGLLGMVFHPNYGENGTFFVNYIDLNGNSVVARFQVSTEDPNRADSASETDLLHVNQPYSNHNGGGLAFGQDGYLYIGLGDGGSGGDPFRNGQNLQTLLGKILRINVNSGSPYSIPPDNPFAGGGGLPEIWAYGLRNPWRFSFDQSNGDLYIGDVGQDAWEEVDYVPPGMTGGMNFGWSYYEGTHPYQDQPPAGAKFTWPVAEYSHSDGCSVTGGYVYRGLALPEWQGVYFYGDYCSGNIWGLMQTGKDTWQSNVIFQSEAKITTFGVDETGEIYLTDYQTGTLLMLTKR